MTKLEKIQFISSDVQIAFYKLVNTAEQNKEMMAMQNELMEGQVYTTNLELVTMKAALITLAMTNKI